MWGIADVPVLFLDRVSSYSYYDTPDGHDIHLKTWYFVKHTFRLGGLVILHDIFLITRPVGLLPILDRVVYCGAPLMAYAVTYPIVTNAATLMRKKDDIFNHLWGAFAVSFLIGAYRHAYFGCFCFVPLSLTAMGLKHTKMEGSDCWPEAWNEVNQIVAYSSSVNSYKQNRSWHKQRPKGWKSVQDYEKS